MAWERRRNGWYYYAKRREGQRVVSVYMGKGLVAEMEAEEALKAAAQRAECRQARNTDIEIDTKFRELDRLIRESVKESLFTYGFYQHKGQWRRRDRA